MTEIGGVPGVRVLVRHGAWHVSATHKEPAARAMVAAVLVAGQRALVVGTCGGYGRAVAVASRDAGLACTVVVPAGWGDEGRWAASVGAAVVAVPGGYEEAVDAARALAARRGVVDGNVDGPFAAAVLDGHEAFLAGLADTVGGRPTGIWLPVGNGTTVAAIGRGVRRRGWRTAVHGAGPRADNAAIASWPGPYRTLAPDAVMATDHNEPLVNWNALHGPEAIEAVATTGGAMHAVVDDDLLAAQEVLDRHGVPATAAGSAGLAGLLGSARERLLTGRHVVVVTGRPLATPGPAPTAVSGGRPGAGGVSDR